MTRSMVVAVMLLAAGGAAAQAQEPGRFGLEVRGGVGLPTSDLADASLKNGGGFEFSGLVRVMPHVHVYAGWDWYRFATDEPFAGTDYDVENNGYAVGLQFRHPIGGSSTGIWLRAGGRYDHIELENSAGDVVADSGHELGWEVGGGMSVPLGARATLTPGVRYRSLSADLRAGQVDVPVDLRYVAAEIGISWTFGGSRSTVTARR